MWSVHGPARRQTGSLLPYAGKSRPGEKDYDHRGTRAEWQAPPGAGGVSLRRGLPVRLLHVGNDYVGGGSSRSQPQAQRGGYCPPDGGQRLPLRHLFPDRRCHPASSLAEGSDAMNEPTLYETEDRQHDVPRNVYRFDLPRRDFFKLMGAGITVGLYLRPGLAKESAAQRQFSGEQLPASLAAWLHIGEDGAVTVFTGKAELGQNIRTSLSQQVAEELHAPISAIHLVMADTDLTPYDRGTFGSRTTPTMGPQLRRVAATAREVLAAVAAERWQVKPASLVVRDGRFVNPGSNQSLSFAELSKGRELVKVLVEEVHLEPPADWKVAGTPVPKLDGRDFVTGRHQYTTDMTRPGMLHITNVRRALVDITASKKQLELQEQQLQHSIDHLNDQAKAALAQGREDLAREALSRKATAQQQIDEMEPQHQQLNDEEQKMEQTLSALQQRVNDFRSKKEVMKAQYTAASAMTSVNEEAAGISKSFGDSGAALQRAQDKIANMQARAAATDELLQSGVLEDVGGDTDDIQRELDQASTNANVDAELAALKAQIASAPAAPELPAGS